MVDISWKRKFAGHFMQNAGRGTYISFRDFPAKGGTGVHPIPPKIWYLPTSPHVVTGEDQYRQ
jgi:hypothetical protein